MNNLKSIVVFIVLFLITWIFIEAFLFSHSSILNTSTPFPPQLSPDSSSIIQEAKSKEIENYKSLISAMHSRKDVAYEHVISKTLMPIFNSLIVAVLGYIFADKALKAYTIYLQERNKRNNRV